MNRLTFENPEALVEIIQFARQNNCLDQLAAGLLQMLQCATIGMSKTSQRSAVVAKDFAPHSLTWCLWNGCPARQNVVLAGGLIYEGPGVPGNGSSPALSVNLETATGQHDPATKHQWRVHT